jgi:alkylation response protein AidB-like acyl-CoA dehydrogenase
MHFPEPLMPDPLPASWALSDDQQDLYATARRFAREQLEPLLTQPPTATSWQKTMKRAAALDLGTMILPVDMGGMAITRHDLALVIAELAAGPLELAAELSLSAAALMTLRTHDALGQLPGRNIRDYFDGTTSLSLTVPDTGTAANWRLYLHADAPQLVMHGSTGQECILLATRPASADRSHHTQIATIGALTLEQVRPGQTDATSPLATLKRCDDHRVHPVQTWLTETALYLCALLAGTMRQSVRFALEYSMERQAFHKPIASHQLVATRLADMLIATHSSHLFLRCATGADPSTCACLVRQLARHIGTEAIDISRELVQLCGAHGYVEGLPPAARFQTVHWFALLLGQIDATLDQYVTSPQAHPGAHP